MNDANLVHIPGTHFTTGWTGGPFLPVPKAVLELVTIMMLYKLSHQDATIQRVVGP